MRRFILPFLAVCLLLMQPFVSLQAQMKRKGSIGVQWGPMTEEIAAAAGLSPARGLPVDKVLPGTTAESLKLATGDIVTEVNGKKVNNLDELIAVAATVWGGDDITFKVWRDKKEKTITGKVIPKPMEKPAVGEVVYDFFEWHGGNVRTILRKPAGPGPFPTVFLIPGYNCFSFDNLPETHPYEKLIRFLVDKGYAVARVEKLGMGDCSGTPMCPEIDFLTEQDAFEKGYENLQKYNFIDRSKMFVFGHSMGGIAAPIIAAKYKPLGVMVYGTRHEPWSEYLMQMLRFQNVRMGVDFIANEADMLRYKDFLYRHYVKKEALSSIAADPEMRKILERDFQYDGKGHLFQRDEKFWTDLEDLNMTQVWSGVESNVLSMFGESDFEVINDFSHKEIVNIVNHYHPGKGTYMAFPGTNHMMSKVGTMEEGVAVQNDPAAFRDAMNNKLNTDIFVEMDKWMREKMAL